MRRSLFPKALGTPHNRGDPAMSTRRSSTELGEEPPIAPGEAPFRTKGTAYLGHLGWVAQHFPGGTAGFLAELSPPMRRFFEQPFLAMSMFDIMPLVCAGHTCARVLKLSFFQFIAKRSRHQAEQDLKTVHRALLRLTGPRMIGARLPMLMSGYFDFGSSSVLESDAYRVRFELSGVPLMYAEWLHAVYDGFGSVLIETTGGVAPHIEVERVPMSPVQGFASCKLRALMLWS
jgi:hypothetical protein